MAPGAAGGSVVAVRVRLRADDPAGLTMLSAVVFLGKLVLWSIAVLLILENAGVRAAFLNAIQAAMERSQELAHGNPEA